MLRSVLMLAASVFVTAFLSVLAVIFSIFSPSGKQSRRVARLWARTVLRVTGTRVKVIGRENIIKEKPHLFMANHQSDFDIPIVFAAIPVDFLWTVKKELFSVPVFGRALKKAGYIEIDRNNPAKAMNGLHGAAEKLRSGMSIATFPEGTRSRDGKLLPFKQGMFYLAIQTGTPIVPLSIIGSGKIMAKDSITIKPGEIAMVIGKPVDVEGYSLDDRYALIEKVRSIIAENLDAYQREKTDGTAGASP